MDPKKKGNRSTRYHSPEIPCPLWVWAPGLEDGEDPCIWTARYGAGPLSAL